MRNEPTFGGSGFFLGRPLPAPVFRFFADGGRYSVSGVGHFVTTLAGSLSELVTLPCGCNLSSLLFVEQYSCHLRRVVGPILQSLNTTVNHIICFQPFKLQHTEFVRREMNASCLENVISFKTTGTVWRHFTRGR